MNAIFWLWFAWKFVPLWYQQQQILTIFIIFYSCDLLENSYLCGISNNWWLIKASKAGLWFAWKFVPLWYQQQHEWCANTITLVVICLKIRTFVVSATTQEGLTHNQVRLWFAWKFVPLWYQQQQAATTSIETNSCDLLENSYLCGISNNASRWAVAAVTVVICLKIRTFVVSATTRNETWWCEKWLWFAWKFVPLWYQQQLSNNDDAVCNGCDLLENSYLCGISNNTPRLNIACIHVVICLKIRTFVVSATT